ncbi:brefeldin A-inhibited guanine nucleotide-exchange protein 3 [Ditylenchus destructor]|nr:brefeldin A-inhibited guanine nucleotide-exchange protein 3 [Ditylenchus destructor]
MEQLLNRFGNVPEAKSVNGLTEAIQSAKESVTKKQGSNAHETRQKCFQCFAHVLSHPGASKPKLCQLAIEGLQLVLRDPLLACDQQTGREAETMSCQMLACLEPVCSWSSQVQCQVLTVIVQLISSNDFKISQSNVFAAMQICSTTFSASEDPAVKLAVRAALTQMLNSYCLNQQANSLPGSQEELAVLMDTTSLLNHILSSKLNSGSLSTCEKANADELQLALDGLYSVLSAQPLNFHRHPPLLNLLKAELIPTLICMLQACEDNENSAPVSTSKLAPLVKKFSRFAPIKFDKKPKHSSSIFATPETARSFYQLVEQIIRLFAKSAVVPDDNGQASDELRLLSELLRTSLLNPPCGKRLEALKLIKRMNASTARLSDLLDLTAADQSFWLFQLESLEECSQCTSNPEISVEAVRSLHAVLSTMQNIITNEIQYTSDDFSENFIQGLKTQLKSMSSDEGISEDSDGSDRSIRVVTKKAPASENSSQHSNATLFLTEFQANVAQWCKLPDLDSIDRQIQSFSIKISESICQDLEGDAQQEALAIFCPDVIYLTSYAILSYIWRTSQGANLDKSWILSKVRGCHGCVDEIWLSEICDNLSDNGKIVLEESNTDAFGRLIGMYDGLNKKPISTGSEEAADPNESEDEFTNVFKNTVGEWIKHQIASCWSSLLAILTRFSPRIQERKGMSESSKILVDGAELTLDCMGSLCAILLHFGMDKEMCWLYERLAEEVCQLEELRQLVTSGKESASKKSLSTLLNRSDAKAIDLILTGAIQCGSLANNVWKYVVRCVEYVSELERYLFQLIKQQTNFDTSSVSETHVSLRDLLSRCPQHELSASTMGKVLDELLLEIDSFFEKAPAKLSLPSLCTLLEALITANENNLKYSDVSSPPASLITTSCIFLQRMNQLVCGVKDRHLIHLMRTWTSVKDHLVESSFAKFPDEVSRLAVSCIHDCAKALLQPEDSSTGTSARFSFNQDLFSAFQSVLCSDVCKAETQESIVSTLGSFIEECPQNIGSGWKPLFGALKAVSTSHDHSLTVKTSSSYSTDEDDSQTQRLNPVTAAVLDVFKKFLAIRNHAIVFPALLEYIHCLLHYLQATSARNADLRNSEESGENLENVVPESILFFLTNVYKLLFQLFDEHGSIPVCSFYLHRLSLRAKNRDYVDDSYLEERLSGLPELSSVLSETDHFGVFPSQLNQQPQKAKQSLEDLWRNLKPQQRCVCELLLSLVGGLASLISTCTDHTYSKLVAMLSKIIAYAKASSIGSEFGAYSLCALVLPTLQKWVRREPYGVGFTSTCDLLPSTKNLKQAMCAVTELVVDYLSDSTQDTREWLDLLLSSFLTLLTEQIGHTSQFISGVGCSCLRHLLVTAGLKFDHQQWTMAVWNLWRAIELTLWPVRKLISQFFSDSIDYAGDIGSMKVSVRKTGENSSTQSADCTELQIMGKQVFVITEKDSSVANAFKPNEPRPPCQFAYVFVFDDSAEKKKRPLQKEVAESSQDPKSPTSLIGLDELIVSLFNHQQLIRLVSQLLLGDTNACALLSTGSFSHLSSNEPMTNGQLDSSPLLLCAANWAKDQNAQSALLGAITLCLDASAKVSEQFDSRPALKFLIQKLCQWAEPVNLYKILVACHSVKLSAVFYQMSIGKESEEFYLTFIHASIVSLLNSLSTYDAIAAKNKLAMYARERLVQPVEFSLIECAPDESEVDEEASGPAPKTYAVVPTKQCLNDFHKQKKTETLPSAQVTKPIEESGVSRPNPFISGVKLSERETQNETPNDGNQQLRLTQLQDLDVCILAYSEVVSLFFERLMLHTDDVTFRNFTPKFFPLLRQFLDVTGNVRARRVISRFLARVEKDFMS